MLVPTTAEPSYQNLKLLFDENDKLYVSNLTTTNGPYQQLVASLDSLAEQSLNRELFCINPIKGIRNKENVAAYVNFMFESDNMPLAAQFELLPKIIELEIVRTITFSGGKSLHLIVSCADDLVLGEPGSDTANERYRAIWLGLERMLNTIGFVNIDKSNKNPVGLSRLPGATRSNGIVQELLYTGKLVPSAFLHSVAVQLARKAVNVKTQFTGDLAAFEALLKKPEHAKFASFIQCPGWVQTGDGNHPMIFRLVCWAHDEFNLSFDMFVAVFAKYVEPVFHARGYHKDWRSKVYGAYMQKGWL